MLSQKWIRNWIYGFKKFCSFLKKFSIEEKDYFECEFQEVRKKLRLNKTQFDDCKLWFRTQRKLFCERKLVIPHKKLDEILKICHESNNHPGAERTILFFLGNFCSSLTRTELLLKSREQHFRITQVKFNYSPPLHLLAFF